jgi:CelD/BcsL family acetyltransferase involved in cellulose biosynthesis
MDIRLIDHFPRELDDLALQARRASFYQTSVWVECIARVFPGMKPRCLVADAQGEILGYLPFFIVTKGPFRVLWSMPFGTYGGPVVREEGEVFDSLLGAYARYASNPRVLQAAWVDYWNAGGSSGFERETCRTHLIDLGRGFETIWKECFDKAKRRQVRKAARENLQVREATGREDLDRYYAIYELRMGEWKGSFKYPREFFEELLERGRGMVKLHVVTRDDKVLGGHVNFYYRDTVTAWNGVTLIGEHQASTLLYSRLIEDAQKKGYRWYNLGSSLGKRPLEEYKEALGGEAYGYATFRMRSRLGGLLAFVKRRLRG